MQSRRYSNEKVLELARDETVPDARVLRLEGTIAEESWFDDDVTPALFKDELFSSTGPVTVWINSPGGDCVAAAQIYNMLMDYPGDVTVKVDGIAASAASVIAMAGTRVLMSPVSTMMIHNPLTVAMGDSEEMRRAIQMLDEVKESIINAYEIKTGLSRTQLSHLMDAGNVDERKQGAGIWLLRRDHVWAGGSGAGGRGQLPLFPPRGHELPARQAESPRA